MPAGGKLPSIILRGVAQVNFRQFVGFLVFFYPETAGEGGQEKGRTVCVCCLGGTDGTFGFL